MDWFRFDAADRIVEHWDVIAPFVAENPSGRSSVDGSTEVIDEGQGPANAALVTRAIQDLLMAGGDRGAGLAVIAPELIQHSAGVADGRDALAEALIQEPAPLVYLRIHRVCAQGDYVAVLSESLLDGAAHEHGDLFRVDDGIIVEHWDGAEAIAPKDEWANTGKF